MGCAANKFDSGDIMMRRYKESWPGYGWREIKKGFDFASNTCTKRKGLHLVGFEGILLDTSEMELWWKADTVTIYWRRLAKAFSNIFWQEREQGSTGAIIKRFEGKGEWLGNFVDYCSWTFQNKIAHCTLKEPFWDQGFKKFKKKKKMRVPGVRIRNLPFDDNSNYRFNFPAAFRNYWKLLGMVSTNQHCGIRAASGDFATCLQHSSSQLLLVGYLSTLRVEPSLTQTTGLVRNSDTGEGFLQHLKQYTADYRIEQRTKRTALWSEAYHSLTERIKLKMMNYLFPAFSQQGSTPQHLARRGPLESITVLLQRDELFPAILFVTFFGKIELRIYIYLLHLCGAFIYP